LSVTIKIKKKTYPGHSFENQQRFAQSGYLPHREPKTYPFYNEPRGYAPFDPNAPQFHSQRSDYYPTSYAPSTYPHQSFSKPFPRKEAQPSNDTLFVSNLPSDADQNSLVELFKDFTLSRVSIPVDRETGMSRGFGFVKFTNKDDCESILQNGDQFQIGEKIVSIQRSKT